MSAKADAHWMARALRLAERGRYTTHPNPRVGCVLVRDGKVVGEGWHQKAGQAHAEVLALRAAGAAAAGATAYVTLEPCAHVGRTPPCVEALIAADVAGVVAAMEDPNPRVAGQGLARLRAAGIRVESGFMAHSAARINGGFVSRMRRARPLVRLKMGASLDGRTAMASGESRWITGEAARCDVHRGRAEAGSVLTGVGTVIADDPSLTVRLPGEWAQPLRIVLDSTLRTPPDARLLSLPGRTLIVTAAARGEAWARLEQAGAELVQASARAGRVDLAAALRLLAEREVNTVWVECGARLGGALLQAGLVDEVVLYTAGLVMGQDARSLAELCGISRLADAPRLAIQDVRCVGPDLRVAARPECAARPGSR